MSEIGHNGGPGIEDDRPGNWFAVSRDIFSHPVVGIHDRPYTETEAWLSMLSMASYEARRAMNKGTVIVIDPGDFMAAHGFLAQRWMWSVDKVRWFLKRLQTEAMITRAVSNGTTRNTNQIQIITLCNYSKYQVVKSDQHQAKPQPNTKPTPSQHQEYNTLTPEQDNPPLPPRCGGKRARRSRSALREADLALTDKAIAAWNAAAVQHGFVRVTASTEKRRRRLLERLADIGGLQNFELALSAVPSVPFLMGQITPRSGEGPFKFEFEHLLQTEGKLGDVLAKLIDKAHSLGTGQVKEPWTAWSDEEWVRQIALHANGIWPVDKLSPPPASKKSACPPRVIESERLLERYDENGFSRGKH